MRSAMELPAPEVDPPLLREWCIADPAAAETGACEKPALFRMIRNGVFPARNGLQSWIVQMSDAIICLFTNGGLATCKVLGVTVVELLYCLGCTLVLSEVSIANALATELSMEWSGNKPSLFMTTSTSIALKFKHTNKN